MSIAFERDTDLAFDTEIMRNCGKRYFELASQLRTMAKKLDALLEELQASGWTTAAGKEFQLMAQTNWEQNVEKYAALLETLNSVLQNAAQKYDMLVSDHIEKTLPPS